MKKLLLLVVGFLSTFTLTSFAADKKIVLVAGSPSHGAAEHEYRAGSLLFQKCLASVPGVKTVVVSNDWPADPAVFDGADAVFIFATGGGGHPAIKPERLKLLGDLMKQGVGFGTCHYGVEVPKDKGGPEFLQWQGGYFEMHWSVNPTWEADFKQLPNHPITRGVKPFKIRDEWYYHMRFAEGLKGVTPILTSMAPASTLDRPDGPHSGNPAVREAVKRGEPQHVAWAYERAGGGRGFGFTGAHYHKNWGDPNFRKVVLNALLWLAKADVPPNGVECSVSDEDLKDNLDPKGRQASAPSPNIAGTWNFNVETQAGSGTPVFTFKQEGEKLTGTYKGLLGEANVTGTIKAGDIKFTFEVEIEQQKSTVIYTGKVEGNTMKGTAKFGDLGEGTWTAKKPAGPQ